jgi:hypothetical protein
MQAKKTVEVKSSHVSLVLHAAEAAALITDAARATAT